MAGAVLVVKGDCTPLAPGTLVRAEKGKKRDHPFLCWVVSLACATVSSIAKHVGHAHRVRLDALTSSGAGRDCQHDTGLDSPVSGPPLQGERRPVCIAHQ